MSDPYPPLAGPESPVHEDAGPPAPVHRWWSPRRPWLPIGIGVLLAAGVPAVASRLADERQALEVHIAETEVRSRSLERDVQGLGDEVAELERTLTRDREEDWDCRVAAEKGVELLDGVLLWFELSAPSDQGAAEKRRLELNRLIREANELTRSCRRSVV